ncbi:MAG: amidohydrolase family protein, partial [Desulfatitalea sp.]
MNQQEGNSAPAPSIDEENIPPHAIVFKVVEHLAYEAAFSEDGKTFYLLGHKDNTPIPDIKLKIKLPTGRETVETTNADGLIEIRDLPIGEKCAVTFEAEEAKLNNSYLWFYETNEHLLPENAPQNKSDGAPYRWTKKELMVGRSHLLSLFRPPVVIDSHMHIQSGRCAPMPGIWAQASVLGWFRIDRTHLENIGKFVGIGWDWIMFKPLYGRGRKLFGAEPKDLDNFYYKRSKLRKVLGLQSGSTLEVGETFIKQRWKQVHDELMAMKIYTSSHLQLPCVVMTMDIEYAHIDGYFGIKIYNGVYAEDDPTKPLHYWFPLHRGFRGAHYLSFPEGCADISYDRVNEVDFERLEVEKELKRPLGGGVGSMKIRCVPCLVDDEETKLYEPWDKQVKYTKQAVIANPLKLLPMYHYDPRRWQERGTNQAFEYVGNNGIYLGFKMYTAQGYRPLDNRLPVLEDFYNRCEELEIPIVNHGTPEGNYTCDRTDYIAFTHPRDTEADEAEKRPYRHYMHPADLVMQESMTPIDHWYEENGRHYYYPEYEAEAYFNEHFVSPNSWEKVLKKYPALRICIAHFGGDTKLGRKWAGQIIDMLPHYDNLYADISSSFAESSFRTYFMKQLKKSELLKKRILFGTDWYLTILGPNVDYPQFYKEAKEFLDSHDTSLWVQFTLINP